MLTLAALLPPATMTRPSGRVAGPGQNMSCPVGVTVRGLPVPLARFMVAVWVSPVACGSLVYPLAAAQVSRLPLGSWATATGTIGKPTVAPHDPAVCGFGRGRSPVTLISPALLHGPRLPASVSA